MGYGLGVDLGTSSIRAAVSGPRRPWVVPLPDSVAAALPAEPQPDGDLLVHGPPRAVAGGPVAGGPSWGLAEAVPLALGGRALPGLSVRAGALHAVLDTVTATQAGPPDRVVLTCPAVWARDRRQEFAEVSGPVGLESVTVISEPEAAAAFFAEAGRLADGDVVVVYDLGAVTVDVTVVRVTATGTEILGLPEALSGVGGSDLDDVLLAHVDQVSGGALSGLDRHHPAAALLERARVAGRDAKHALSELELTSVRLDLGAGAMEVGLRRAEFEAMIQAGLESTRAGLRRTLASAGVGMADLAAVVLVGGSARIPLVARMVERLGRPVLTDEHPEHCAARGAAALAAGRGLPRLRPRDVPTPRVTPEPIGAAPIGPAPPVHRERREPGRLGEHRRVLALAAVTALLLGWGTYFALRPVISGSDVGTTAGRGTGLPLLAGPSGTPSAGSTGSIGSIGSVTTQPAVSASKIASATPTARVTTSAPAARATATQPSRNRNQAPRAAIGTGALIGLAGKCLDVQNALTDDGTPVQLYTCNGTLAQVWTAKPDGSLQAFGKCLQERRGRLVINGCDGRNSQRWQIIDRAIVNPQERECVAVLGEPRDQAPVAPAGCRETSSQVWHLTS